MIKIKHIAFAYGKDTVIFDDFSLDIESGSLYGLLGPNGAGKTSLISLITGLNKPSTGQITINGLHYGENTQTILNSLSLVPQEYAFYSQLSVNENLHFFAKLYPDDHGNNIAAAIKMAGLDDYQDRKAGTLSGGLKRRLNLAIGLLNKPSLLILDEPTVGIDPQSRHFILEAIQTLNAQGTTIIYTSHYMNEIEKICTRVGILDKGKILREGALDELLTNNTAITINSLEPIHENALSKDLQNFIKTHQLNITENALSAIHLTNNSLNELINLLHKNHININQIRYGQQSLEDVFFDLTHTRLREG